MLELRKNLLPRDYREEDFEPFFRMIQETTAFDPYLDHAFLRRMESAANRSGKKSESKELFMRAFVARAYELQGHFDDAANCYDRAAKAAGKVHIFPMRGELLKKSIDSYLKAGNLSAQRFENIGYSCIKASRCFEEDRLKSLRMLKLAEQSFACAGNDIENIKLYFDVLNEIKTNTIDSSIDDKIKELKREQGAKKTELVVSEILFAKETQISLKKLRYMAHCRNHFIETVIFNSAEGRIRELTGKDEPGFSYRKAADALYEGNTPLLGVDIYTRAGRTFLNNGKTKNAAVCFLQASRFARDGVAEGLFSRGENILKETGVDPSEFITFRVH